MHGKSSIGAARLTTLLLGLAGAAVVAVATAGCGSSVTNALDPVARAATISNAAPGYRMNMTMRIESASLPSAVTATGSGSFTPAARTGQLTLAMDFGSNPALSQVLGSSTLTMRELLDGDVFYVKLPAALTAHLPGGKPWLEINLAKAAASQGISGISSLLNNPASSNPAQLLQYLKATSGGVKRVGTATIDGRATTEYHATIDLSKVPDVVGAADRSAARQAIAAVEQMTKVTRVPVDVWVDSAHLVRQMTMQFTEHVAAAGGTMALAMKLDIPSYGPQPTPAYPSASQVTNADSLLSAAGSSTTGA